MLKTDLHVHTADDPHDHIPHTTLEAIDRAAELDYRVLAITLHDRQLELTDHLVGYARERGVVLIAGVERTLHGKHVLLLNFPEEAERVSSFNELRRLKRRARNGVVIAPHAFYPMTNCLRGLMHDHADVFDAVELNHFYTAAMNFNRPALRWAAKHGKPVVGNGDIHRLSQLGKTFSLVDAEPSADAICDAIRAGRVQTRSTPLTTVEAATYFTRLLLNLPDAATKERAGLTPFGPVRQGY